MTPNKQPTCKICKTDSKMIWRGTEWICHGTHALDQSPNERPTPRTDNEAGYYDGSGCWRYNPEGECVTSDFSRSLERLLAERTEERDTALAKLAAFSNGYVDSEQHNAMARTLAKCREALESCRLMVINEIECCKLSGRSANAWPDLLTGCVSGGGIEQILEETK